MLGSSGNKPQRSEKKPEKGKETESTSTFQYAGSSEKTPVTFPISVVFEQDFFLAQEVD